MYAPIIEKCIGAFNRWQLIVFLLVFLVNFPLSMQELAIVFLGPPQNFTCSDSSLDQCSEHCPSHIFDLNTFKNTIVSQWDLTCSNSWLVELSQTILMLGILFGNFCFGYFSDKFGRRKPLIAAIILEVLSGIGIAFAEQLWLFMALRFLVAVAAGGTLVTGFVIVVEVIGRKYRPYFGILFQMTYYIGHATLGCIAYALRDWRYLQLTISLPVVLLLSYIWLLPESPRWLLTVGRYEEAIKVLEKAAKFNKMPTENIRSLVMHRSNEAEPVTEDLRDLFRNPVVRMKTLCICFNWIILGLSFFGVAQYIGKIGGDIYINSIIAGLIQIPGNFVLLYAINKAGRKACLIFTYVLCGVSLLLITVMPLEPTWIISILGCVGMMAISLSFATMFLWSGELYPTVVRNIGMGTSAMCAKFGSMAAPFVSNLKDNEQWIPPFIFGLAPLIAMLVSLKLPETLDTVMPDTIEESSRFRPNPNPNQ